MAAELKTNLPIQVAALYRFVKFDDFAELQGPLQAACDAAGTKGTILLAHEGVNGTIAGSEEAIAAVLDHIRTLPDCAELEVKYSHCEEMPFLRMKVRLKKEIVTMGEPDIDPNASVGTYVDPLDWNDLIADPDTIVIDTRNDYEVSIGQFKGAIDPKTKAFRDFPGWFREQRAELLEQGKTPKVAMYCTGGIRCEKSTSFLKSEGVEDVFHLKGGILKYLENVPQSESQWEGECFVFDSRVSVGHGLVEGSYELCFACRRPLDANDLASDAYAEGVSCPHCISERNEEQRARYAERQHQQQLAKKRGEQHVGGEQISKRAAKSGQDGFDEDSAGWEAGYGGALKDAKA
ncbi:MAG: rhodanese-related sulfurtransferase [Marinomonas sp.]